MMTPRFCLALCVCLYANAILANGYVDTDLGRLHSRATLVNARVERGTAVTRLTQRFEDDALAGMYRVRIPAGAMVTDLVAWYGERRVQGGVLPARYLQTGSTIRVVQRQRDGDYEILGIALQSPGAASVRVELEYAQLLAAVDGGSRYQPPLLSLTADSLACHVVIAGYDAASVQTGGPAGEAVAVVDSAGLLYLSLVRADVREDAAFDVDLRQSTGAQLSSWRPDADTPGFYSIRLQPADVPGLETASTVTLSIALDLAHASPALWDSTRIAIGRLLAALPAGSLVGFAAHGIDAAYWHEPLRATDSLRAAILDHLSNGAGSTESSEPATLGRLTATAMGSKRHNSGPHFLLVVTDDTADMDASESRERPHAASRSKPQNGSLVVHAFPAPMPDGLAAQVAEDFGVTYRWSSTSEAVAGAIETLAAAVVVEHLYVGIVDLPDVGAHDIVGHMGWVPPAAHVWQSGRFRSSGLSRVRVRGPQGWHDLAQSVSLARPDSTDSAVAHSPGVLLHDDFSSGNADGWIKAGGTAGRWTVAEGVLTVTDVNEIARIYRVVPASSYTISVRIRVWSGQGKVIFLRADRNEYHRLDMFGGGIARLAMLRRTQRERATRQTWYDIRIEVTETTVSVWVDGDLLHDRMPLEGVTPDGVIGLGSVYGKRVDFDDVLVTEGIGGGRSLVRGLLPHHFQRLPARVWAETKVAALQGQRTDFGEVDELLEAITDLGLGFGVITDLSPLALALPAARQADRIFPSSLPDSLPDSSAVHMDHDSQQVFGSWPNPFNAETTIVLPWSAGDDEAGDVRLEVFDLAGQRLRTLPVMAGNGVFRSTWDGRDNLGRQAATGVYYYRLVSIDSDHHGIRRPGAMMLLR
jgi:hypothetical protein